MRRIELIHAVEEVITALKICNITEVLREYMRRSPQKDTGYEATAMVFDALKQYSIAASKFSAPAKKLAEILDLNLLESPRLWANAYENRHPLIHQAYDNTRFAIKQLPKIVPLLEQESLRYIAKPHQDGTLKKEEREILSVIVIEQQHHFSSPARLIEVLSSIASLYNACAIMTNAHPEALSVVACDSGSDKSFDFLGAAKVIECVKEIIISLWDRVVFFREKKISQQIDLIAQSLPVIEQIAELEKENKLGPEQAELLRRGIIGGVTKFIESGSIIPEIEDRSYYNPRVLMAPVPKLLVSSSLDNSLPAGDVDTVESEPSEEGDDREDNNLDNLSQEEWVQLFRLLKKTQKKNNEPEVDEDLDDANNSLAE